MAARLCLNCVFARVDSEEWLRAAWRGEPMLAKCANHPRWPGVGLGCHVSRGERANVGGGEMAKQTQFLAFRLEMPVRVGQGGAIRRNTANSGHWPGVSSWKCQVPRRPLCGRRIYAFTLNASTPHAIRQNKAYSGLWPGVSSLKVQVSRVDGGAWVEWESVLGCAGGRQYSVDNGDTAAVRWRRFSSGSQRMDRFVRVRRLV